jgi:hypothetical protein
MNESANTLMLSFSFLQWLITTYVGLSAGVWLELRFIAAHLFGIVAIKIYYGVEDEKNCLAFVCCSLLWMWLEISGNGKY